MFWKRQLPIAAAFIFGVVFIIQYYVPHHYSQVVFDTYVDWMVVMGAFAAIMGFISILRHHTIKVIRKSKNWQYSTVTIICVLIMIISALISGREKGTFFSKMFLHVFISINATMFSLLGFYIASAAYRAFRARSAQATALLLAAVLVMLGRVPIGETISFWSNWNIPFTSTPIPSLVDIANWIMNVPNMASKRAIMLGVALGIMLMSLKIILGIERTYLGGKT